MLLGNLSKLTVILITLIYGCKDKSIHSEKRTSSNLCCLYDDTTLLFLAFNLNQECIFINDHEEYIDKIDFNKHKIVKKTIHDKDTAIIGFIICKKSNESKECIFPHDNITGFLINSNNYIPLYGQEKRRSLVKSNNFDDLLDEKMLILEHYCDSIEKIESNRTLKLNSNFKISIK